MLLQNGALMTIKDYNGECPIHFAALKNSKMALQMVDKFLTDPNPNENIELIIEALELTALSKSCKDPFECMKRATVLRMEHNVPKRTLEPMECYGYQKEWETLEELEEWKEDKNKLTLQTTLARERIHKGQNVKLMELLWADDCPHCKYP